MPLELYMLGLIVQDMSKALEFYRRLGLAVPDASEAKTHVEVKMSNGMTLFLDSRPSLWDPAFVREDDPERRDAPGSYPVILEFYLKTRAAVAATYNELTGFGYHGYRPPYATSFGMYFAMIKDPDGNTILLSGDLEDRETANAE